MIVGAVGVLLAFSAHKLAEYEWLKSDEFLLFTIGLILSLLFISVSIERAPIIQNLFRHFMPKFVVSLLFTATLIYSTSVSSGIINGVFGIDAGAAPYARAYLAGIVFFRTISIFFVLLLIPIITHLFGIFDDKKEIMDRWYSGIFFLCALIVLGRSFYLLNYVFKDENIQHKAYELVHRLDFSDRALCVPNESKKSSILFIGPAQERILIDEGYDEEEGMNDFFSSLESDQHWAKPANLKIMACMQLTKDANNNASIVSDSSH